MGYWNHRDLVLGDAPADRWTRAWRRILDDRRQNGQPYPTVHDALSALVAALRERAIWPKTAAVVLTGEAASIAFEPTSGTSIADEWASAIRDLDNIYVRDLGRPPTAHEALAMFEFVVRPEPGAFFADGESVLTGVWSLVLRPDVGPVRDDFSCVFTGVRASAVSRLLIENAGGVVLERAVHETVAEAAHWAKCLLNHDPEVEALTFCETEALGFSPPNTVLIRRGRLAATFGHEHVRRWSEAFGTWCVGLETAPRPRVVGAFLGASIGADDYMTTQEAATALNQLSDSLGFSVSDVTTGFGVAQVETWLVRSTPPLGAPRRPRVPVWLGAIAVDPAVARSVLRRMSPPDDWRLLDGSTEDRPATFSLLRGTADPAMWSALTTALDGWALAVTLDGDGAGSLDAYQCGGGHSRRVARGPTAHVAAFGDLTLMVGEAPGEIRWPAELRGESGADRRPPGLFEVLVSEGLVREDDVARLERLLSPDSIVHPHGSERLDSTRWPSERDARLAAWAAQWLPDPTGVVSELLLALPRAGRDLTALRRLVDVARDHCDDALLDDDADPVLAMAVQDLAEAHLAATEGLDAYHVHRRLPGLAATHAAAVVRIALERDVIDADALIEVALVLLPPILEPPTWFWQLIEEARGVADLLRPHLEALPASQLAAFHAYQRDLATRLTGDPWRARLPEDCSDETSFEAAAWVVTLGRDRYRAVAFDSTLMTSEARPGTRAARAILGLAAEVWDERFEPEPFPSDYEVGWNPDGTANPSSP
ncbi:MAG: hypothetical protein IV100_31945 [Myxococcales bacterium]|nr:hypothetical protein [Myxococcales bacterium]